MSKRMSILILSGCIVNLLCFSLPAIQQEIPKESPPFPKVEIKDTELRTLKSKHVGEEYKINIFFPKDYDKENRRYPVVYVLDAEYNFGCVAYITRRLIKNGDISKILLVGIAFEYEEAYASKNRDMHAPVYLSVGEDESQRMREGSINLNETLSKREYPHLKFQFSLVEGENHRSLFPFAFSRGLRFVFSGI